jgi:hypothetical protein
MCQCHGLSRRTCYSPGHSAIIETICAKPSRSFTDDSLMVSSSSSSPHLEERASANPITTERRATAELLLFPADPAVSSNHHTTVAICET